MASNTSTCTSTTVDMETLKRELFRDVMRGEWDRVVRRYKDDPSAQTARITRFGHTALHMAVSDAKEHVVEQLVGAILESRGGGAAAAAAAALSVGEERGHTALHFAAAIGNVKMCECMAGAESSLVGARNNKGETPLYWAVMYGQRDAFLSLNTRLASPEEGFSYCWRDDGQTILHCAIFREDFELAYEIIHLYKDLVNRVDEQGLSPLHTLASKPQCFKSGTSLGRWDKIIFNSLYVDKLRMKKKCASKQEREDPYPKNYDTFVNFIMLLKTAATNIIGFGKVRRADCDPEMGSELEQSQASWNQLSIVEAKGSRRIPKNYVTCFEFGSKIVYKAIKAILVTVGYVSRGTRMIRIEEEKEKHIRAVQILDELLEHSTMYDNVNSGSNPYLTSGTDQNYDQHKEIISAPFNEGDNEGAKTPQMRETRETAILVAAKNGVCEIVERILQNFPVAIHDADRDRKNALLLAVESRQVEVYKFLLKSIIPRSLVIQKVDNEGNTALHFAAMYGDNSKPWPIPGAALQMQWEFKWFKFVEKSMPRRYFAIPNKEGKTAEEIFSKSHKDLIKAGGEWLTTTSKACSVVAALIATVAFASSTTVPSGTNSPSGKPTLENHPTQELFTICSLIALCFSVTSLIMFLAILTSRYHERDFRANLPRKLLLGLTSFFLSIIAMLTSFCSGYFFMLENKLKYAAFLVYSVTVLPTTLFAVVQFPLYVDLVRATFWSPF